MDEPNLLNGILNGIVYPQRWMFFMNLIAVDYH
jgi:hypothetical protein